jgi:hypothetical protein
MKFDDLRLGLKIAGVLWLGYQAYKKNNWTPYTILEMVNGNKKLIEIYEQKIKDKIGEVWGEE